MFAVPFSFGDSIIFCSRIAQTEKDLRKTSENASKNLGAVVDF